jgi:hypothetical protein
MTVVPTHPTFLYFPNWPHFDTSEVIEAELQGMINTLTKHDFQDAFEIW